MPPTVNKVAAPIPLPPATSVRSASPTHSSCARLEVAFREDAPIDRGIRLAEPDHRPAQHLIALRDRAGADLFDAAAMHHQIGIGADQRHAARRRRRQQRIERGQVFLAGLRARHQHEIRLRRIVDQLHIDPVQHRAIARRHDRIELAAAALERGDLVLRQLLPGLFARGVDVVVEIGRDAHLRAARRHLARAARRVGEDDRALAGGFQAAQGLERGGIDHDAVMQAAPEIEDESVIAIRDFAQAMDMDGHAQRADESMKRQATRTSRQDAVNGNARSQLSAPDASLFAMRGSPNRKPWPKSTCRSSTSSSIGSVSMRSTMRSMA